MTNVWKALLIGLATLLIVLFMYDYAAAKPHQIYGLIKDSDYDSAYTDSDGHYHSEVCEVYVKGDDAEGWATVPCALYFSPLHTNDLVQMQWRTGPLSGIDYGEYATRP